MDNTQSGTPHRWKVLHMTFLAYLYDSLDLQILAICMPVIITRNRAIIRPSTAPARRISACASFRPLSPA